MLRFRLLPTILRSLGASKSSSGDQFSWTVGDSYAASRFMSVESTADWGMGTIQISTRPARQRGGLLDRRDDRP
jgi:hypothetical protein